MSRTATRFRTILPSSGRTALGATIAGGRADRPGVGARADEPAVPAALPHRGGDRDDRCRQDPARRPARPACRRRRRGRGRLGGDGAPYPPLARLHGFRFLVVPGDNAATRLGALDEVFHDEPVDGVIHVVANGHATPRRTAGTTGTATATREEQLAAELEDWAITSHRIASMAVRRDKPVWLVIAVTKTDLYPDELDEVVDYYSPGAAHRSATRSTSCGRWPAARSSRSTCSRCPARAVTASRPSRPRRPARWSMRSRPGWPS